MLLCIALIITFISARKIVKPILEITKITTKIANLDFSERYLGKSKDEVGILGNKVNIISEKLNLTIRNLKIANEKLQNEMKLQKRFLMSISHEFKTPVGLIRGYSESIQMGMAKNDKDLVEFSEIIIQEADKLTYLISDIIYLIRLGSESFRINAKNFNLSLLLKNILLKFSKTPEKEKYDLKYNIIDGIIFYGDEARITQVIENLLSNAIRHVHKNGTITVNLEKIENKIKFEITNTGYQILDNDLSYLFNPFYTTDISRSKSKSGTGLGLSIAKSIVEKHSGKIGVYNIENGVTFWIEFPIKETNKE